MLEDKHHLKKDMIGILTQTIAIFIFQLSFCLFILYSSVITDFDSQAKDIDTSTEIAFARFICGISMHLMLTHEISMGLKKMKFALNHKWKF